MASRRLTAGRPDHRPELVYGYHRDRLERPSPVPCPPIRVLLQLTTLLASLCVAAAVALPASAVIIKLGDGTGNTTPPADDPGLANVGVVNFLSAVYLGNGWVLTANHVGQAPITLGTTDYPDVPGSSHQMTTPGVGPADLRVFKIDGDPGLPAMNIASSGPPLNASVIMHGNGRNRGNPVSWGGADGWQNGTGRTLRWGTNRVVGIDQMTLNTKIFFTQFDENGGQVGDDEAQSTNGDSGGAVFYKRGGAWELSGMMFANGKNAPEQPDNYVLFGNQTLMADLSAYRDEILSVISQPTCDDGIDEDGDGLVDYPADPGCESASDNDERDPNLVCDDGIDSDGDGLTDWPADPGCADSSDDSEQSESLVCDDGVDNDGDGLTDHPEDTECGSSPTAPSEGPLPYVPVSSGFGTGALMALLGWLGRSRAGGGAT